MKFIKNSVRTPKVRVKKAILHDNLECRLSRIEGVTPRTKKLLALLETLSFKDGCRLLQTLLSKAQYETVMGWLGEAGEVQPFN